MFRTRTTKSADPKVDLLKVVPELAKLSYRDLAALALHFDDLDIAAGQSLIREGQAGRELFLIVDGQAVVSLRDEVLATVGAGEFVGEMTLFERLPRSATVTALTPMRVLVAGMRSFDALRSHPMVLRRLVITLAGRLRTLQGSPSSWSDVGFAHVRT